MRIVGGKLRGRRIVAPSGRATRPSSDRLRQTLFDVLTQGAEDAVSGARVLDLFAGTGAFGLEALSRGARMALFVENDSAARAIIRRNIEDLGLIGPTRIFRRDATRLGPVGTMPPFDLVFADPPYGHGHGERALVSAIAGGWLAPGARVVLEESADAEIAEIAGLEPIDDRKIGGSRLRLFNAASPPGEAG